MNGLSKKNPPLGRVEKMDRPHEPVFGSGAGPALAYAASWLISLFLVFWLTH
jgi:hypothetical protein